MGRKSREKWESKLAPLTALAKPTGAPVASVSPSRRMEAAQLIAGASLSLAGLRSDDLVTVNVCFVVAVLCFVLVVFERVASTAKRGLLVALIAVVFAGFGYRSYGNAEARTMAESKSNMRIEMGPVDLGGQFHAMYTLHNAWNSEISKYRTECHFNRVMDDKGSGFIVGTSDKNAVSRKSWIESAIPSGAGATERCFTDYMAFNGPVVCTDVTVDMEYQLTSYPSQTIRKSQRFVVARGNGPHWFEELVDTPGDYCTGGYR